MDKEENEEFEGFLRQFHLRKAPPLPAAASELNPGADVQPARRPSLRTLRWGVAAAAVFVAVMASVTLFRNVWKTGGPQATIEEAGALPYKAGDRIEPAVVIQSGDPSGNDEGVVRPENGSVIEQLDSAREESSPQSPTVSTKPEPTGAQRNQLTAAATQQARPGGDPPEAQPEQPAEPQQPAKPPEQQESPTFPDGPGKQVLDRACSGCHSLDFVRTQRLPTKEDYAGLISREIVKGAQVPAPEFPVLVDYLFNSLGRRPAQPAPPNNQTKTRGRP